MLLLQSLSVDSELFYYTLVKICRSLSGRVLVTKVNSLGSQIQAIYDSDIELIEAGLDCMHVCLHTLSGQGCFWQLHDELIWLVKVFSCSYKDICS